MQVGYAAVAFAAVFLVTVGVALFALWLDPVSRRLRDLGEARSRPTPARSLLRWEDSERAAPQWRRSIEKLGRSLLGRTSEARQARQSAVRRRLVWAGFDNPRGVFIFLGCKVVLAGGLAYSYTLYGLAIQRVLPQILLVSVILGVIGFFLPNFCLSHRIKGRQRMIRNALPDVLDLLVVCVEAGMGLDAAIA